MPRSAMRSSTDVTASRAATEEVGRARLVTGLLLLRAARVLDCDLLTRLDARDDLDLVEAGQARLHLTRFELVLPLVLVVALHRRVLGRRRQHAGEEATRVGGLRGRGLLDVDDLGVLLAEEALDRDGQHFFAALAQHV